MTTALFIWDTRAPNHPAARDTLVEHEQQSRRCRVGFALNLTMADPRALVAFLIGLISFPFIPGILWSLGW